MKTIYLLLVPVFILGLLLTSCGSSGGGGGGSNGGNLGGGSNNATDTTVLASVNSNGNKGNGNSISPSMSSDGRYVVFESKATNLDADDTDGLSDIYIHDRDADEDDIFDELF